MGKTERWWNNPRIKKVSGKIKAFIRNWNVNPFYGRHELKEVRVELHRESRHANRIRIKKAFAILMNSPVLFGLKQQGHIPKIEEMLRDGASWEEIGKEIHWDANTAKEHYNWYLEHQLEVETEKKTSGWETH